VTWPVELDDRRLSLYVRGRVSEEDAGRQTKTAKAVLDRLRAQPGVVLADEVGMGKTFVAMAVAASVAWSDRGRHPVVVMVPPSLKDKWPRDFNVFSRHCIMEKGRPITSATAEDGVSFLKLLDDPLARRKQIIFLTHGALSRGLTDPWTKLAILKSALRSPRLADQRRAFPRFAAEVIRVASRYDDENLFRQLMATDEMQWRSHLPDLDDDPVPESIIAVLRKTLVDLRELRDALVHLPIRHSANRAERVSAIRRGLSAPLRQVWHAAITESRFRSPLLILDEAHHLKNPATALASLFVTEEAANDASELQGALEDRFERMLFLTATPFQLGHDELLKVLTRFRGVRWKSAGLTMTPVDFDARIDQLRKNLDAAQRASLTLEERWGTLDPGDLPPRTSGGDWWAAANANRTAQSERLQSVMRLFDSCSEKMREAETLLRPWVIRHLRNRNFERTEQARRVVRPGSSIANGTDDGGLAVSGDALLPFLLVARSQAIATSARTGHLASGMRRLTFVEGLASSYEAYLQTRAATAEGATVTDLLDEDRVTRVDGDTDQLLRRYLDELTRTLASGAAKARHPKIAATVQQAVRLWEAREKLLIFCHFRATGRSLEEHIRQAIDAEIAARAAEALRCSREDAKAQLAKFADAFDPDRPAGRYLEEEVSAITDRASVFTLEQQKTIVDVIRRFVRTESFLVRYFPLDERDAVERVRIALDTPDDSGLSLRKKFEDFIQFLANRDEERDAYLQALAEMQTQHNVRRATGDTDQEQRRRLLLSFNTPFFPEVLIASSVLSEGVDLHLDCRYIIHHDLSWNPSTLEQRTGRVDRIGAKAERVRQPIHVFLPYLGGTQDEKMYRVVRDREHWFQVLMGEQFEMSEGQRERIAERVALPESAARALAFKLDVV